MDQIDLTKPFKLTIKGELIDVNGKKWGAGIYPPNEQLPNELRLAHYGENVDPDEAINSAEVTELRPRQPPIFSKPQSVTPLL